MKVRTKLLFSISTLMLGWASIGNAGTLFQENFEDGSFSARGWYDNTAPKLSSVEHAANSTKSLEFHFAKGAVTPDNAAATMRKKFTESDSVYVSYYIKHSAGWVGSGVAYHPHQFYLLTNLEGDWSGLIPSHMTAYIEENGGNSVLAIQDSVNVNLSNVGKDLTATTENRAVAGCNGDSDGYGNGDCYASGSGYANGKQWKSGTALFSNTTGTYYKGDWHLVETYFKLNSIVNGKGVKDGILQQWYDGRLVMNYTDVVFRTAQNPNMKFNQFLIGPYIGVGSPVDQTFWIDNLVVATAPPVKISAPQNLRVISQ
ncbi:heparin lyase I family protein [Geobacter sp. SVR]|uniref:heparin lyase I family protein n=1 Tax=Geobacter sp. SVR TaxID=2495594 RepID=UPI00143EF5D5|nr:heparin lyase I family protein [Geobacter sp. SVR]BCS54952.1 hypothetical protein GSVR_32600 [Geobacter sp. SVR]GCF86151.1 hypothetical protein GSbR_27510 [Geobacter sp. SVR]